MTSVTYIDTGSHGKLSERYFCQHSLSNLTKAILDTKDPSGAITRIFRLANLLLLANQIDKAHQLLCSLYKYAPLIAPTEADYRHCHASTVLDFFWCAHPALTPPDNASFKTTESSIARWQWAKYRECCRTGWMLEHCKLAEPKNPHCWTDTDDPAMLAMCCRLLAKKKEEGEYPSLERMQEALDTAKKLYVQPQVRVTEYVFDGTAKTRNGRHSYLIYRRLAMHLAIYTGDLDYAAEVLSTGLRLDGFNSIDGGQAEDYLSLPRIYEVLPLLAKRGKEGNPFFINEKDAEVMVKEIDAALELRSREGRQRLLAPEKVGWEELLDRLAKGAWQVNKKEYRSLGKRCADDILFSPATEEEIKEAERKVGELPADFKEIIRVANG